jgi:predicted 2-oxoglutarate/Fe(II)-dependent dioxygenase YbiX
VDSKVAFKNGIITARTVPLAKAKDIVDRMSVVEWKASTIAHKHDVIRIKESVDKRQRDALSAGFDKASKMSREMLGVIKPVALSLIKRFWELELSCTSAPQFTLYKKGHFISAHRDSGSAYPDRLFSVVTYLTDNYSGGEIYFPGTGTKYHPRIGESLIFPCDMVHGVNPISSGEKEIFLFFVDRHDSKT